MSAKLSHALLFSVVIASLAVSAADDSWKRQRVNLAVRSLTEKTHHLVVEEVDDNGRSEVKELELPDYNDSEELREDEKRRREQWDEFHSASRQELCEGTESTERRRCLLKWRRWLRMSYRTWRKVLRHVLRVMDARYKNLSAEIGDLTLSSPPPPGGKQRGSGIG